MEILFPDVFKDCETVEVNKEIQWLPDDGVSHLHNLQAAITGKSDEFKITLEEGEECTCPLQICAVAPYGRCNVKVEYRPQRTGVKKKRLNFDGFYKDASSQEYEVSMTLRISATSYPSGHPDSSICNN